MRTDAEHGRLRFEQPRHLEQLGAAARIRQSLRHIREEPPRAFQAVQPLDDQTRAHHFRPKLVGAMKVCRGEVVEPLGRVPMLSLPRSRSTMAANRGSWKRSRARPTPGSRSRVSRVTSAHSAVVRMPWIRATMWVGVSGRFSLAKSMPLWLRLQKRPSQVVPVRPSNEMRISCRPVKPAPAQTTFHSAFQGPTARAEPRARLACRLHAQVGPLAGEERRGYTVV